MKLVHKTMRLNPVTINRVKRMAEREHRSFNNMVQVLLDQATKSQPAIHKD